MNSLARLYSRVWQVRLDDLPPWRAYPLAALRLLLALGRDLAVGQLTLQAMGLVYTSLLSLVPLLALSFSMLKAFGVHNELEPALRRFLAPLGSGQVEMTGQIIGFIDNVNVGLLGSVGLALVLYGSVSLVRKVELSFDYIWHVTRHRTLGRRWRTYLGILLVGPVLVFGAMASTVAASNLPLVKSLLAVESVDRLALLVSQVTPYLLVIGAFAFAYGLLPNTRVQFRSALVGSVVGGVLWQSAGWAFTSFVAHSSNYAAIYSGFAVVLLFMIWLYVSWLILLLGASVSFYVQHPEYLISTGGEPRLSNRMRERLALLVMSRVASSARHGGAPWSRLRLARNLGVPSHAVAVVLDALQQGGLLTETSDRPPCYLPGRALEQVTLKELLDLIRAAGEDQFLGPEQLPVPPEVADVLQRLERATGTAAGAISVAELVAVDERHTAKAATGLRET